MLPRQHSMDSETSSDSWLVIQKSVSIEHSNDEMDIESSLDSEHWDSDNEDSQYNDENETDSLEEFEASADAENETGGDCEIVDENEAMQMSCSRYFIAAEKIYKSLDLLDEECSANLTKFISIPASVSRDTARAIMLLFVAVLAVIFFSKGAQFTNMEAVRHPNEVIASGQQYRKNFVKTYMPMPYHETFFNNSESLSGLLQCKRWQKFSRSSVPTYLTPQLFEMTSSIAYAFNSTPFLQVDEEAFFARPVMKIARISISRPPKRPTNVCVQNANRQATYWSRKQKNLDVQQQLHISHGNFDNVHRSNIRVEHVF
ncbi:hypothetical protein DICVIV_06506 [Dictyocaulus viviparus]|uniref:Uncharacterized protein n=1 Tax=Dictyocaulus viviparus TaxID=29172 RepID=A0A0D8XSC7_DICVI|nr:hypothetical protein DICVIV_06506 [Dictyocaulus viviparus]